jgi:glutamine synthetase
MGPGRVEVHHHEVASCQLEIGVSFNTLVRKADVVKNQLEELGSNRL